MKNDDDNAFGCPGLPRSNSVRTAFRDTMDGQIYDVRDFVPTGRVEGFQARSDLYVVRIGVPAGGFVLSAIRFLMDDGAVLGPLAAFSIPRPNGGHPIVDAFPTRLASSNLDMGLVPYFFPAGTNLVEVVLRDMDGLTGHVELTGWGRKQPAYGA